MNDAEDEGLNQYIIIFTDRGQMEYDNAALWYAAQSPDTAKQWLEGFEKALSSLSSLPGIHPIAGDETQCRNRTVRRLLYRQFRILYFVLEPEGDEAGTVNILSVQHGAARPKRQKETDD